MQLHQRGVDLLVDVLDAADHVERLSQDEIRHLLKEVAEVMCQLLERDVVVAPRNGRTHWTKKPANTAPMHPSPTKISASRGEPGSAD